MATSGSASESVTTLGDVLDANPASPRTPETEWVRLLASIAAGDQQALQTLYARTQRIVFTLTMRITGNRQTAEEVMVDVFHDVWRRAGGYDPAGGSVVGWMLNQARSRAIDRLRHDSRKKRVGEPGGELPPAIASPDPHVAAELSQQGDRLHAALCVLTPDERAAIETAYFQGLTHEEVATRLGQPVGTVKTRIRAGIGKLRKELAEKVSL